MRSHTRSHTSARTRDALTWLTLVATLAAAALLSACATAGNERLQAETPETVATKLQEGTTTKDQVRAALGEPQSVSFTDGGSEIWTYKHARATPAARNFIPFNVFSRGADVTTKEVVVMFDKAGVVSRHTMRETQETVRRGLAH